MIIKTQRSFISQNTKVVKEQSHIKKLPGHKVEQNELQQQKEVKEQMDTNSTSEFFGVIFLLVLKTFKRIGKKLVELYNFAMQDLGGSHYLKLIEKWCAEHPSMSTLILAGGCVMSLPFLLLTLFVFFTILMALIGFLLMEGTMLAFLSLMLIGLIGAFIGMCLFLSLFGVIAYSGFCNVSGWHNANQRIEEEPLKISKR